MADLAIDPAHQPFYDALADGRLLLAFCAACGRHDLPGTGTCPVCLSHDPRWEAAGGAGTVFSFLVFRRPLHPDFEVPYSVCVVELDEGPRVVAWLVGVEPEDIEVGMPVHLSTGPTLPLRFRREDR
ncbi:MAG: uncharacterized protein QOK42_2402 [Frankiaceae bacterium]|nr:uncharacterized protein [Frankiaceae bacterium]